MEKFLGESWKLSQLVLRALALGLGLPDENYLLKYHDSIENELSFKHYPPVKEAAIKSGALDRIGAHTDIDSFTLLWQDDLGGLAIKHPGTGKWTDVLPIEGAVIMNSGDILGRWSNGMPAFPIFWNSGS